MRKVFVYVEGQTEETFIRDVLAPHLSPRGLILHPVLAKTKRTLSGAAFKGGITSYAPVRRDIMGLLRDSSAIQVTTMIDYYGLPDDFPGKNRLPSGTPAQRVAFLEDAFRRDIDHPRFLPFLVLHEFEALLFADPRQIIEVFRDVNLNGASQLAQEVQGLQPEEINDGPQTHPSERIRRHIPEYRKRLHGPMIAGRIGLAAIREQCPHFDGWVRQLENL
jgi:hypothetical protein